MTDTLRVSPKITSDLYEALSVLILSAHIREAIDQKAVGALSAADPYFEKRLLEARTAVIEAREQARLDMGGAYIVVDGVPLCKHSYLALKGPRPPCYSEDVKKVIRDVEQLRSDNPSSKITYQLGMCPKSGE